MSIIRDSAHCLNKSSAIKLCCRNTIILYLQLIQGGELFLTYARNSNLYDESLSEVGYIGSWSRIGPWLPWFEKVLYIYYMTFIKKFIFLVLIGGMN